jgi:hypothetical protein
MTALEWAAIVQALLNVVLLVKQRRLRKEVEYHTTMQRDWLVQHEASLQSLGFNGRKL